MGKGGALTAAQATDHINLSPVTMSRDDHMERRHPFLHTGTYNKGRRISIREVPLPCLPTYTYTVSGEANGYLVQRSAILVGLGRSAQGIVIQEARACVRG